MKRLTTGLLLALGAANAMSFEELNGLRTKLAAAHKAQPTVHSSNIVSVHPMAEPTVKHCGEAHCSEIGAVLADTCTKNNWQEGKVVMLYHIEPKEVCYCNCPKKSFGSTVGTTVTIGTFLSEEQARVMAMDKSKFHPLSDENTKRWNQDLQDHYKNFFPEVTFHLLWDDDTVNAKAWFEGTKRHIAIYGGLARHKDIAVEGIALVIAHELAHHYGGAPYYPGEKMSCEGQADYAGVRDLMRKVWFGEEYVNLTRKAIAQIAASFNVKDDPTIPPGTGNCSHPPGACRVATFYTALTMEHEKPKCAN